MKFKDYYETLGIKRDASESDIKRAYRKLARKYHPDVSAAADAEQRFKEVGEAYNVLNDPEKRSAYDQLGEHWEQGQDFRPPPEWATGFEFHGDGSAAQSAAFSDFFESLFGGNFARQQPGSGNVGHGADHHAKIVINLKDAYFGATRTIVLQSPEYDEQGHVRNRKRSLRVGIPKGVIRGQHIRLSGQGSPAMSGGPAGDLYLEIEFEPHEFYRVDEKNVSYDLPVTPWEAAIGAKISVPTPQGTVGLKIPPGSSGGKKLRLKGKGIPGSPAGNLIVTLRIELPSADNEIAKELYKKMAEELPFNPRQNMRA